jgi:hypothetical protein
MVVITQSDIKKGVKRSNFQLSIDEFKKAVSVSDFYGYNFTWMIRNWIRDRLKKEYAVLLSKNEFVDGLKQTNLFPEGVKNDYDKQKIVVTGSGRAGRGRKNAEKRKK